MPSGIPAGGCFLLGSLGFSALDGKANGLLGSPLAAFQINAPEIFPERLDGGDFAVFGTTRFERLCAVEGEASALRSGIGEDNLNPFGRGSDVLDFGCTDGQVEVRADQHGCPAGEGGEAQEG